MPFISHLQTWVRAYTKPGALQVFSSFSEKKEVNKNKKSNKKKAIKCDSSAKAKTERYNTYSYRYMNLG